MTVSEQYANKLGELNDELEAENAELRAEIERMRALHVAAAARAEIAQIEIERLRMELAGAIGTTRRLVAEIKRMKRP